MQVAHVLKPARISSVNTCSRCLGAKGQDYAECRACAMRPQAERASQVGVINYALDPGQTYDYFKAYKNPDHLIARGPYNALSFQLASVLVRHFDCSNRLGPAISLWTNVPSTRRDPHSVSHPLHRIAQAALANRPQIPHLHTTAVSSSRDRKFSSNRFSLQPTDTSLKGRHVLILEDLWVSGASADSLASQLLSQGAFFVSVLALGRKVNANFGDAKSIVLALQGSSVTYNPKVCPWNPYSPCTTSAESQALATLPMYPAVYPDAHSQTR